MLGFFSYIWGKIGAFFVALSMVIAPAIPMPQHAAPNTSPAWRHEAPQWTYLRPTSTTPKAAPVVILPKIVPKTVSGPLKTTIPLATSSSTEQNPAEPPIERPNTNELNLKIRDATVNILCTTKTGGPFEPISGSGIMIDSRGIVLTNAHIGQYFLLEDIRGEGFLSCGIRTGSPAGPAYTAELLYISEAWIQKNAAQIKEQIPLGTGEHDYALLRITGSARGDTPLPASFTYAVPNIRFLPQTENQQVLIVSYPAELLGGILIQNSLNQISTLSTVREGFYFQDIDQGKLDIFSVGGTIVAQGGSSGGGVVSVDDGTVVGVLVTSTEAETTDQKDLKAISIAHINRSLERETGKNLKLFLDRPIDQIRSEFYARKFSELKKIILDAARPK